MWSSIIGPFGPISDRAVRGTFVAAYFIIIYATYILYVELATFARYKWDFWMYVTQRGIWTYINWINSVTLWIQGLFVLFEYKNYSFFWAVYSFSVMFIWLKSVYFMKSIPQLGWMIKMIETASVSAIPFLVILIVTIAAFSEAFFSHSKSNVV